MGGGVVLQQLEWLLEHFRETLRRLQSVWDTEANAVTCLHDSFLV